MMDKPINFSFSESIEKLAPALIKAQSQIKSVHKSAENPYFRSKYADLATIIEASRKPLTENNLAFLTIVGKGSSEIPITGILLHSSGQWLSGTLSLPVDKRSAQAVGSAISYGRRYAMVAMLNIATDDDDDGNAATHRGTHTNEPGLSLGTNLSSADRTKKTTGSNYKPRAGNVPKSKATHSRAEESVSERSPKELKELFEIAANHNVSLDSLRQYVYENYTDQDGNPITKTAKLSQNQYNYLINVAIPKEMIS